MVPSLPGFGFSDQPTELGWDPTRTARGLGGADAAASATPAMSHRAATRARPSPTRWRAWPRTGLVGIHLNFLSAFPIDVLAALFGAGAVHGLFKRVVVATLAAHAEKKEPAGTRRGRGPLQAGLHRRDARASADDRLRLDRFARSGWRRGCSTTTQTATRRSRARFVDGNPTGGLTRDRVLDNITLYWLTGHRGVVGADLLGGRPEHGCRDRGRQKPAKLSLPVAFTVFPGELFQAPRSWAEKVYPNLIYFNEVDKGGHFAAWEEPELFARELRAAFSSLR